MKKLNLFLLVAMVSLAGYAQQGFIGPMPDTFVFVPAVNTTETEAEDLTLANLTVTFTGFGPEVTQLPKPELNLQQTPKMFAKKNLPKLLLASSMQAVAGWFDGESEVLLFDFEKYQKRWPNTNESWTNPEISSRNKYKNWPEDQSARFPGSKGILVGFTDKYHMNRMIRNVLLAGSVTVYFSLGRQHGCQKEKFAKRALRTLGYTALSWASYAAGSGAAHAFYGSGRPFGK